MENEKYKEKKREWKLSCGLNSYLRKIINSLIHLYLPDFLWRPLKYCLREKKQELLPNRRMDCLRILLMVCILCVTAHLSWCMPRAGDPGTNNIEPVDKVDSLEQRIQALDSKLRKMVNKNKPRQLSNINDYFAGTEDTFRRLLHARLKKTWSQTYTNLNEYYQKKWEINEHEY